VGAPVTNVLRVAESQEMGLDSLRMVGQRSS
jgi:hypothetical protein